MWSRLWKTFGDGCELDRETGEWIQAVDGWDAEVEHTQLDAGVPVLRTLAVGVATKRGLRL